MFNKKSIIIVLAILAVASGVIFVFFTKRDVVGPKQNQPAPENTAGNVSVNTINLNESIENTKKTDKDLDGLTDEEEKKLGTKINVADSDGDGVLDSDEVSGYKTDPNKADSDGDGYEDGYEIRRGYNPLGKGNL